MLIYISHPCTGDVNGNREKAHTVAVNLASLLPTDDVIEPLELLRPFADLSHKEIMEIALAMLKPCDAVVMCGDWRNSKGCMAEWEFARDNGIRIYIADTARLDRVAWQIRQLRK